MIQGFSSGFLNRKLMYNLDLPSFQRDFASLKTLDHGTGPAITFTRASGGTYFDANGVLQTASNDVPRFDHDPATGASRGLLIEEARTNLLERSAEFDNAYWTKTESSVDANAIAAPDGTTSAEKLKTNTNSAEHSVATPVNLSVTSGVAYTISVFAKKAEKDILFINFSSAGFTAPTPSFFDLTTGTATAGANVTASMVDVGNGWYRCIATKTATATVGTHVVRIGVTESTASSTSTGANSTDGLHIWGAQFEQGAFPTSYIPTTSAAVTRSADSAVVTPISSFYNQSEGTLFAEYSGSQPNKSVFQFDNNTNNERVAIIASSTTAIPAGLVVATTTQASIGVGATPTSTDIIKAIFAAQQNDFQAARGGALGTADTSGTMPAASLTNMNVGSLASGSAAFGGHIRKLAYWPKRLTNTLLEQLTT